MLQQCHSKYQGTANRFLRQKQLERNWKLELSFGNFETGTNRPFHPTRYIYIPHSVNRSLPSDFHLNKITTYTT